MQTLHRIIKNSLDKKKRLPEGNLSCGDPGEIYPERGQLYCLSRL